MTISIEKKKVMSYMGHGVGVNYGKFNIRFQAPVIWDAIKVKTGSLKFKLRLKEQCLSLYC